MSPVLALIVLACHPSSTADLRHHDGAPHRLQASSDGPGASRPVPPVAAGTALQDYALIKKLYAADGRTSAERDPSDPVDLMSCATREPLYANDPPKDQALEDVARDVVDTEASLRAAGFPASIYGPPLADYERGRLDMSSTSAPDGAECQGDGSCLGGLRRRLAQRLNEAGQVSGETFPRVVVDGGCGAAEQDYVVRTSPAGGRVWFITDFAFRLCAARKQDPWNRATCDRWRELAADQNAALSGDYRYEAEWSNGVRGRGERSIDGGFDDTADMSRPKVITVGPG